MSEPLNGLPESLKKARECLAGGDAAGAERTVLDVLRRHPMSREPLLLFADISQQLGKPQRAVLALEQAIGLEPDDPALWMRLGALDGSRFHWGEAARAYEQAVRLAPHDPQALVALGFAQLSAQRTGAAVATRRKLLERFPDCAAAQRFAGNLAKALGDLESAATAYRHALRLAPDCTEALFHLVDMEPSTSSDLLAAQSSAISGRAGLAAAALANVDFAQARIHETEGRFDAAFASIASANARQEGSLRAAGVAYDAERSEARTAAIIAGYPAASFRTVIEPAPIDLTPIFIVGMPRSGTTLVEQILGSHPQVCAGGELAAAQLCEERYLAERPARGLGWPPDAAAAGEAQLLMEMRERYLEYLFENELDADFVTDKLPGNFMSLGFIRMMIPHAVIVHCVRDPVATCWSLYAANLGQHAPAYTSLGNLAHAFGQYRRLMAHWKSVLQPAMAEIQYESLVADPEGSIRRLLSECGLPWDARCLEFHGNARAVTTASALQVRKPMYSASVDKWRNYQAHLGPLLVLREAGGPI